MTNIETLNHLIKVSSEGKDLDKKPTRPLRDLFRELDEIYKRIFSSSYPIVLTDEEGSLQAAYQALRYPAAIITEKNPKEQKKQFEQYCATPASPIDQLICQSWRSILSERLAEAGLALLYSIDQPEPSTKKRRKKSLQVKITNFLSRHRKKSSKTKII